MKGMNMLIWANAWQLYHTKNFGAARKALEFMTIEDEDAEFREQYDQFMELLNDHEPLDLSKTKGVTR